MKKTILLIAMVVFATFCQAYEIFPICTNPSIQTFPAVSNDTVIWSDYRNGEWNIFGYRLSDHTEFSIPTNHKPRTGYSDDRAISINGDNVVWMSNEGIYGYNLSTKQEFLVSSGTKHFPEIDGDIVVWENVWSMSYCNLKTKTEYFIGNGAVPAISKDKIVFHDSQRDIYLYDLSNNSFTQITNSLANQCNPDISNNIIVWRDDRTGKYSSWDIWAYDLNTNERKVIGIDTGYENYPRIDGGIAVWSGGGYNLLTNTSLQIPIGNRPDVSGNLIVWDQNGDIYGAIVPEPCTLLLLGLGGLLIKR